MERPSPDQPANGMHSGPACLWYIVQFYDKHFSKGFFQEKTDFSEEAISLTALSKVAEAIGFRARCVRLTGQQLLNDAPLPSIITLGQNRYAVLLPRARWGRKVRCVEPGKGVVTYTKDKFLQQWSGITAASHKVTGEALLLEPTFGFRNKYSGNNKQLTWRIILQFFKRSRLQVSQLITALLITSLFQLIFPFLMQSIVDVGITTHDLNYIMVVLIAQVMLVISRLSVDVIRGRLLLHISTTVNLSILSDFWIKLTRLPVAYFDRTPAGEILQRINDNKQVQNFLTGPALNTMFSILNFIVFAVVLMMYKIQLFFIFMSGMALYFGWIQLFLSVRRKINYQLFNSSSRESNTTLQLVQGMQEIRLNNIGQSKRWEWEAKQVDIFRLNYQRLTYTQLQHMGAIVINQGKDVVLTFMVAKLLIEGQLTFGAMLAVQYIIGQLSAPVEQLIGFIQNAQDAKISMERLNEVHQMEDEEKEDKIYSRQLPASKTIVINDLSFGYPGSNTKPALNNIHLEIPEGKTTAIVGESGSGKTTLIKLLLKFYDQYDGSIQIGDADFKDISPSFWRDQCASVLQDGYIFNDSIAKNIALEHGAPDMERLEEACRMANILSFIETLPDGLNTRLGANGSGISQGQKQRLLIARAVYKDPGFLFLDESTSSLDETNERVIVENLRLFSKNRTVIVIAHRLSTVKNADNIVVLHQGHIVEQGTHHELAKVRGRYFRLIKNQLELGIE